jgi:pectin methylesterase-like acyl-CoA thioesterase
VGQAVAVWVKGDKVQFRNCRFLGFQDTLYTMAMKVDNIITIAISKGQSILSLVRLQLYLKNVLFTPKTMVITPQPLHLKTKNTAMFLRIVPLQVAPKQIPFI